MNEKALDFLNSYPVLSFPNWSKKNPLIHFELAFVTLSISYPQRIDGVDGHQVGLVLHNKEWYYVDSLRNGGKMLKMDGCSPPSYLKNWSVGTACYARL
jgi:hypothetical protein